MAELSHRFKVSDRSRDAPKPPRDRRWSQVYLRLVCTRYLPADPGSYALGKTCSESYCADGGQRVIGLVWAGFRLATSKRVLRGRVLGDTVQELLDFRGRSGLYPVWNPFEIVGGWGEGGGFAFIFSRRVKAGSTPTSTIFLILSSSPPRHHTLLAGCGLPIADISRWRSSFSGRTLV